MTTSPVRLLTVPTSEFLGRHAAGVIRCWIDNTGEITVVRTSGMDAADKLKIATKLMRIVQGEGYTPKGVAFS